MQGLSGSCVHYGNGFVGVAFGSTDAYETPWSDVYQCLVDHQAGNSTVLSVPQAQSLLERTKVTALKQHPFTNTMLKILYEMM